ncbi:type III secretion system export apparatus subunit SctR [soil metagenome]
MNPNMVGSDPIALIAVIAGLTILPLLCVACTSFLKFAIVLMVTRNAIGVQQVPPQIAIYGIALALTAFVMAPVGYEVASAFRQADFVNKTVDEKFESASLAFQPWKEFLIRNTTEGSVETFVEIARNNWPAKLQQDISAENPVIVVPAFVISELKVAFEISFLIYIPFIIIDIVVSNILLALGMQMVAPMTFATPLKLLLFVAVDGWAHLLRALSAGVA